MQIIKLNQIIRICKQNNKSYYLKYINTVNNVMKRISYKIKIK